MALEKQVIHKGVSCDYWKVFTLRSDYNNGPVDVGVYKRLHVSVALYVDKATRIASVDNWLAMKHYTFIFGEPNAPADCTVESIYTALKQLPEFDGAQDD